MTTPTWLDRINITGDWLHLETHLNEQAHCSQAGQIEGAGAQVFGLVTTAQHPTDSKHSSYVFVWRFIWLLHVVGLLLFGVPPRGQSTHLPVIKCRFQHFPAACLLPAADWVVWINWEVGRRPGKLHCTLLRRPGKLHCTLHCTNLTNWQTALFWEDFEFAFMSRLDPKAYLVLCHL